MNPTPSGFTALAHPPLNHAELNRLLWLQFFPCRLPFCFEKEQQDFPFQID